MTQQWSESKILRMKMTSEEIIEKVESEIIEKVESEIIEKVEARNKE